MSPEPEQPDQPARPARQVPCPGCGQPAWFAPENRWRPFCSARCRQIDLGAWASERWRLTDAEPADSLDSPPPTTPAGSPPEPAPDSRH